MTAVRQPVLAGAWYPGDPEALRSEVSRYLAAAEPERMPPGVPTVVLAPHAGYAYSGPTAGKALGPLQGRTFPAVFIFAPNHRTPLDRPALSSAQAFATPLGEVPVATDIVQALADGHEFVIDDRAHAQEHAVEIQLPFLQCALPAGTPVVPVLVPHMAADQRRRCAQALDPWRDRHHLFLVSSDLTHYGQAYGYVPFQEDIPAKIEELDTGALLRFLAHDPEGLEEYGRETGITMCGLPAAALALDWQEIDQHHGVLLDYTRSADQEGDFSMSVSYAAAMICREPAVDGLSDDEWTVLLTLARQGVEAAVRGEAPPVPQAVADALGLPITAALREDRGAFVTLELDDQLRGCIGFIEGIAPLVESVVGNAASAAVRDPRFFAVTEDELPALSLEVSALTPLAPVAGPDEIVIGRHGVVLTRGGHKAVFLPQVATEQGWDRDTTLSHLAMKAGLGPDGWREGCSFQVFEAEIRRE